MMQPGARSNPRHPTRRQVQLRLPSVMDALGITLANPTQTTPEIPARLHQLSRPVIDEGSASDLSWPVKTGSYDGRAVRRARELPYVPRAHVSGSARVPRRLSPKRTTDAKPDSTNQPSNMATDLRASTLNLTSAQVCPHAHGSAASSVVPSRRIHRPAADPRGERRSWASTPSVAAPSASVTFQSPGSTKA